MEDQLAPHWQKSSYSGNGGGDCVEVARNLPLLPPKKFPLIRDERTRGRSLLLWQLQRQDISRRHTSAGPGVPGAGCQRCAYGPTRQRVARPVKLITGGEAQVAPPEAAGPLIVAFCTVVNSRS